MEVWGGRWRQRGLERKGRICSSIFSRVSDLKALTGLASGKRREDPTPAASTFRRIPTCQARAQLVWIQTWPIPSLSSGSHHCCGHEGAAPREAEGLAQVTRPARALGQLRTGVWGQVLGLVLRDDGARWRLSTLWAQACSQGQWDSPTDRHPRRCGPRAAPSPATSGESSYRSLEGKSPGFHTLTLDSRFSETQRGTDQTRLPAAIGPA